MAKSRLTDAQIAEIRRLYALRGPKTYDVGNLASMFGTSKAKIRALTADQPRGTRGSGPEHTHLLDW